MFYQWLSWTISPMLSAHGWQTNRPVIRRTQSCWLCLVKQWLSVSSLVRGTSCTQWSQPSPWSQGFILNRIYSELWLLFIFLFFFLPLSRRTPAKRPGWPCWPPYIKPSRAVDSCQLLRRIITFYVHWRRNRKQRMALHDIYYPLLSCWVHWWTPRVDKRFRWHLHVILKRLPSSWVLQVE